MNGNDVVEATLVLEKNTFSIITNTVSFFNHFSPQAASQASVPVSNAAYESYTRFLICFFVISLVIEQRRTLQHGKRTFCVLLVPTGDYRFAIIWLLPTTRTNTCTLLDFPPTPVNQVDEVVMTAEDLFIAVTATNSIKDQEKKACVRAPDILRHFLLDNSMDFPRSNPFSWRRD